MTKKTLCFILAACLLLAVPALAAGGTGLRTSEAGIAFIKDKEGFSAQAYEDSTGWAIGYGTPARLASILTASPRPRPTPCCAGIWPRPRAT